MFLEMFSATKRCLTVCNAPLYFLDMETLEWHRPRITTSLRGGLKSIEWLPISIENIPLEFPSAFIGSRECGEACFEEMKKLFS